MRRYTISRRGFLKSSAAFGAVVCSPSPCLVPDSSAIPCHVIESQARRAHPVVFGAKRPPLTRPLSAVPTHVLTFGIFRATAVNHRKLPSNSFIIRKMGPFGENSRRVALMVAKSIYFVYNVAKPHNSFL